MSAREPIFLIQTVAEKTVDQLSAQPLFWRVETFSTAGEAAVSAGPTSLLSEANGRTWRFTLGTKHTSGSGGTLVAEIGPVPIIPAARYLLRINRAGGPPGVSTPIHTHPGSEAFYVLAGRLCQRTAHGISSLDAGASMNGHEPGMAMQLSSCGTSTLDQFVMFVVDSVKPFSVPASFP